MSASVTSILYSSSITWASSTRSSESMSRSSKRESGLTLSGSPPNSTRAEITLSLTWSLVAVVIGLLSLVGVWIRESGGHAAVDRQDGSGHIPRLIGGQEADAGRHLLGGSGPSCGNRLEQDTRAVGIGAVAGEVAGELGLDQARRYGVHGDPAAGDLRGHCPGEGDQPRLGSGVVGLAGIGTKPDDRGDVDHPAEAPTHHRAEGSTGEAEGGGQVDVEHPGPVLVAESHREVVRGGAGVVDEHQNGSELLGKPGQHLIGGGGVADIGRDRQSVAAVFLDRGGDRFGTVAVAAVVDPDRPAVSCESPGRGGADPARCAGDQGTA